MKLNPREHTSPSPGDIRCWQSIAIDSSCRRACQQTFIPNRTAAISRGLNQNWLRWTGRSGKSSLPTLCGTVSSHPLTTDNSNSSSELTSLVVLLLLLLPLIYYMSFPYQRKCLSQPIQWTTWLYHEFGISSVYHTGLDAWLIILARTSRMFAYGANSLIMALFFSALGFSDWQIGSFMTLTLLGDVLLSLSLSLVADRIGRRRVLFAGAILMVCSGTVFAYFENFWILLVAAVVGVISATGGDFGPFRAIEESTLSGITKPETRSDVLSWYVTTASLGSAAGTELAGRLVDWLRERPQWTLVDAYHSIFLLYVGMGLLNMLIAYLMSSKCELTGNSPTPTKTEASEHLLSNTGEIEEEETETGTLPHSGPSSQTPARVIPITPRRQGLRSLLSQISHPTLRTMTKLWALLAADSTADGMVSYSLTTYYLDRKFALSRSTLGDITSISYLLASLSTVFAGPLAKRLGLINTMVATHIPSSAAVALFPAANSVSLSVVLFLIRTGLNNMDQAPRTAFIAAVVRENERTAVMGITGMLRTLASAAGPSITGFLAGRDAFWIAFVAAGLLRLAYDFGLWALFASVDVESVESRRALEVVSDDADAHADADVSGGVDIEMVGRRGFVAPMTPGFQLDRERGL